MSRRLMVFDRLVDSLLTEDLAELLIRLRADPSIQARVDELGDKCNEGLLTPEEREEYEAFVAAFEYISLLQAKSRALLSHQRA